MARLATSQPPAETALDVSAYVRPAGDALSRLDLMIDGAVSAGRGDLEAAAREYEEYLTPTEVDRLREDGSRFPPALLRLGEIHQELGNYRDAASWYERFADLWENADPEFQPSVDAARTKAEELRARVQ